MSDAEKPRYRLRDKAFMAPAPGGGSRLLDAGTEIVYDGRPSANMEPLNFIAEQLLAAAKIKPNSMRPELALPLHGPGGGEAGALQRQALGFDEMIEERFRALEGKVATLEDAVTDMRRAAVPVEPPPPVLVARASPQGATMRAVVPPPPPSSKHGKGA